MGLTGVRTSASAGLSGAGLTAESSHPVAEPVALSLILEVSQAPYLPKQRTGPREAVSWGVMEVGTCPGVGEVWPSLAGRFLSAGPRAGLSPSQARGNGGWKPQTCHFPQRRCGGRRRKWAIRKGSAGGEGLEGEEAAG